MLNALKKRLLVNQTKSSKFSDLRGQRFKKRSYPIPSLLHLTQIAYQIQISSCPFLYAVLCSSSSVLGQSNSK